MLVSMLRCGLRTDPVALAFGFISEMTDPTTFVLWKVPCGEGLGGG